jgi:hypothetical protein
MKYSICFKKIKVKGCLISIAFKDLNVSGFWFVIKLFQCCSSYKITMFEIVTHLQSETVETTIIKTAA